MPSTRGVRLLKGYIGSSDELARQSARARVAALAPVLAARQQRINDPLGTHTRARAADAAARSTEHTPKADARRDTKHHNNNKCNVRPTSVLEHGQDRADAHEQDAMTSITAASRTTESNMSACAGATGLPHTVMTHLQQLQSRGACHALRKRQLVLIHSLGSEDSIAPQASRESAASRTPTCSDPAAASCRDTCASVRCDATSTTATTTKTAASNFAPSAFRVKRGLLSHISDMVDVIALSSLVRSACGERVGVPGCALFVLASDDAAAEVLSTQLRDRYALPVMLLGESAPRFPSFPERAAGLRQCRFLLLPSLHHRANTETASTSATAATAATEESRENQGSECVMRMSSVVPVVVATPAGFLAVDRRSALWKFIGSYVVALTESHVPSCTCKSLADTPQGTNSLSSPLSSSLLQLLASSPSADHAATSAVDDNTNGKSRGGKHGATDKRNMTAEQSESSNNSDRASPACAAHALARQRWRCLAHCSAAAVLATDRAVLVHPALDWLLTLEPVDEPSNLCDEGTNDTLNDATVSATDGTQANALQSSSSLISLSTQLHAACPGSTKVSSGRRDEKDTAGDDGRVSGKPVVYYAVADGLSRFQFLFGLVHSLKAHRGLLVHVSTRPMAAFLYNAFYALSSSSSSASSYTVPSHVQLMTDYDGEGSGAQALSVAQGRALCDEFDAIVLPCGTCWKENSNSHKESKKDCCYDVSPLTTGDGNSGSSSATNATHYDPHDTTKGCVGAAISDRQSRGSDAHYAVGAKRARTPQPPAERDMHAHSGSGKTAAVLFSCQGLVPAHGSAFLQYDILLDIPNFNAFVCDALTPGDETRRRATLTMTQQATLNNNNKSHDGSRNSCSEMVSEVGARRVTTTRSRKRSVSPPPASLHTSGRPANSSLCAKHRHIHSNKKTKNGGGGGSSSRSSNQDDEDNTNASDETAACMLPDALPRYRHILLLLRSCEVQGARQELQSRALRATSVLYRPLPHPPSHTAHLLVCSKLRALHQKVFAIQNAAYAAYKATMTVYCTVGPRTVYDRCRLNLNAVAQEFGFDDAPLLDLRLADTPFRPRADVYKAARLKQTRERAAYRRFAAQHIVGEMPEEHVAQRGDDEVARRARKRW